LRSALTRGYSLEFAKKSFVNSGYNLQDVEDSASILVSGAGGVSSSSFANNLITSPSATPSAAPSAAPQPRAMQQTAYPVAIAPQPQSLGQQSLSQSPSFRPLPRIPPQIENYKRTTDEAGRPRRRGLWLVILLIIIFLIVLGVLGLLIFKRELVESMLQGWGLI